MATTTTGRYRALDGLRGVAILLVLASHMPHSQGFPDVPAWWWHLGDLGNLGVRIFFVLSGFIITHLLLREERINGRASLPGFYRRRAFRIFPPLFVFLGCMVLLRHYGVLEFPDRQLVLSLVFLANHAVEGTWNLGHLWSLAVEEQFYLLWPVMVYLCGWRGRVGWTFAALVLAPAWRLAGAPIALDGVGLLHNSDALATGCLAALLLAEQAPKFVRQLLPRLPGSALAALILLGNIEPVSPELKVAVGFPMVHLAVALIIMKGVLAPSSDLVQRSLQWPPLLWLGTISYSLYLWQQPVTQITGLGTTLGFPLNLLIAIGAATASLHLVERPALRWRRRSDPPDSAGGGAASDRTGRLPEGRSPPARAQVGGGQVQLTSSHKMASSGLE